MVPALIDNSIGSAGSVSFRKNAIRRSCPDSRSWKYEASSNVRNIGRITLGCFSGFGG